MRFFEQISDNSTFLQVAKKPNAEQLLWALSRVITVYSKTQTVSVLIQLSRNELVYFISLSELKGNLYFPY